MKKIVFIVFCILFSSCKKNDEEQKLIYEQFLNYQDELRMNADGIERVIILKSNKDENYKSNIDSMSKILIGFEKSYEKLKYNKRVKIIENRNLFNDKYRLFVKFETSNYDNNVSDTIFNRLMEIDFYRLKFNFQNRYLLGHSCM